MLETFGTCVSMRRLEPRCSRKRDGAPVCVQAWILVRHHLFASADPI